MAIRDPRAQLRADAAWHRSEAERLAGELARMTPSRAAAIGPNTVRRMHVDHDTHLQLAEELEAYLTDVPGSVESDAGQGGLF